MVKKTQQLSIKLKRENIRRDWDDFNKSKPFLLTRFNSDDRNVLWLFKNELAKAYGVSLRSIYNYLKN